jgi:hypothetical protein
MIRKFGLFDSGFAAKKFLVYHLGAIVLFYFAGVLSSRGGIISFLVMFAILSSSYPFHGWIEHFFSHAPSRLVAAFLLFFRPVVWFFTLQFISAVITVENYAFLQKAFLFFGLLGCLFVPVLFFAKQENRKFLSYAVCWQNGVIWLFLAHCRVSDYIPLFKLSVMQGFLLTLPLLSFVENQKHIQSDGIISLRSIFSLKKSRAYGVCLTLIALGILPLFTCCLTGTYRLYVTCSAISCPLYFYFTYRAFVRNRIGI